MNPQQMLCDINRIGQLLGGDIQLVHELLMVSQASLKSCRETVFASCSCMDRESILRTVHQVKGIGLTIFSPCLVQASEIVERNSSEALGEHVRELCGVIEIVEQLIGEWTTNDLC